MKELAAEHAPELAHALLAWFHANKRPLPWRRNYTPYEVWISEIMLQQTQMERGVEYFLRWMKRFPDIAAVAAAPEESILQAWEGLGYYRRARHLHQAAKAMVERYGGQVPARAEDLSSLPGLGPYTVAAILGIAFEQDVVVVDANVERVFSRLLDLDLPPRRKPAATLIRKTASSLLPSGQARDYNQALMEFGALVCGKNPHCQNCPLTAWCESRRQGTPRQRPVLEQKPALVPLTSGHGLLIINGRVLVHKRPANGLWAGLWEFPGQDTLPDELPGQAVLRTFSDLGLRVRIQAELGTIRHGYTYHRLTASFYRLELDERDDGKLANIVDDSDLQWINCRETDRLAMPAHHRKLADRYFSGKVSPKNRFQQYTF